MLRYSFCLLVLGAVASAARAADPFPPLWVTNDTKQDAARLVLGRPGYAQLLAFSPDNKTLAGVSGIVQPDPLVIPIQLWDADTGKHVRTLTWRKTEQHYDGVWSAAFSPDGSVLAVAGRTHLRFFDTKSGKDITKEEISFSGHGYVTRFSPDGKRVLVGNQKLELFDAQTQKRPGGKNGFYLTGGKDEGYWAAAYSPKGKYVAAGNGATGTVQVWEAESGKFVCEPFKGYFFNETRIGFPDEKTLLVTDSRKGEIITFDVETGKQRQATKAQISGLHSVEAAPGGSCVAWPDRPLRKDSTYGAVSVVGPDGKERQRVRAPEGVLFHILSPDGSRLAVSGPHGSLTVYTVETGKPLATMLGPWPSIVRAVYADGGKTIRVLQKDWLVRDFDAATGKQLREAELPAGENWPTLLAVDPSGKYLATTTSTGEVAIFDLAGNKELTKLKLFVVREYLGPKPAPANPPDPKNPVPPRPGPRPPEPILVPRCVATFSPDGKLFAALTSEDGTVTVWDTATGAERGGIKVPKGTIAIALAVDFASLFAVTPRPAPEGKSPEVEVRRFDLKAGKELKSWKLARREDGKEGDRPGTEQFVPLPLPGGTALLVTETQNEWSGDGGRGRGHVLDLTGKNADRVVTFDVRAGALAIAPDGKAVGYVANVPVNEPEARFSTVARTVDLATGKTSEAALMKSWRGNTGALAFRPDGKGLLVTINDTHLLVIDGAKLREKKPEK
jgi:WD40 repeat protein